MNISIGFLVFLWFQARRQKFPLWIFLGLLLNIVIAPAILANTDGNLTRGNAYALGLLGLVIISLTIYLFFVIFQPEKF